jgi:hypothetical protein
MRREYSIRKARRRIYYRTPTGATTWEPRRLDSRYPVNQQKDLSSAGTTRTATASDTRHVHQGNNPQPAR